jgi:hypothetical protein
MWVFVLLVAVESACPNYICTALSANICTNWDNNEIKINSSGCAELTQPSLSTRNPQIQALMNVQAQLVLLPFKKVS